MSQNFHVAQLSIEDEGENPNKIHAASGIIEDDAKLEVLRRRNYSKDLSLMNCFSSSEGAKEEQVAKDSS